MTRGLPGVGGRIRSHPSHFVVEEIPLYEPCGDGQHLYVNLTKTQLTTREVQRSLARSFSVRVSDVGFAGLKDKHACATQTFSLPLGKRTPGLIDDSVARIADSLPVRVNWAKRHTNKLRLGHLRGNRFRVVIDALPTEPRVALARTKKIADGLLASGLPNFFGAQRFGAQGGNAREGLDILLGRKRVRERWKRRFLISAYQSHLCNLYLSRRLHAGMFEHLLEGDVAKIHASGGMFDVVEPALEMPRFDRQEISHTAPMFGARMRPASGPAGELEAMILDQSPLTLDCLRKTKVEGTRRMGRLLLRDWAVSLDEQDLPGALTLGFSLPKGAFATTILREFMKNDTTSPSADGIACA